MMQLILHARRQQHASHLMQGKGQNESRDGGVQITGFVTDHKVDPLKLIRRQVWL